MVASTRRTVDLACWTAVVSTLILVVIDIGLNLVMMLTHLCAIEVNNPVVEDRNMWFYVYSNYLGGEDCAYKNFDAKVVPIWPQCVLINGEYIPEYIRAPARSVTDPDATFIWVVVLLVLDIFWALTALVMIPAHVNNLIPGLEAERRKKPLIMPWVAATGTILAYGLVATIVYIIDIGEPLDFKNCKLEAQVVYEDWLPSTLVMPAFFSRGFFTVWAGVLALMVVVIVVVSKYEPPQTLLGERSQVGESLSVIGEEPARKVGSDLGSGLAAVDQFNGDGVPENHWSYGGNQGVRDDDALSGYIVTSPDSVHNDAGLPPPPPSRKSYRAPGRPLAPSQLHINNQPPIILPLQSSLQRNESERSSTRMIGRPRDRESGGYYGSQIPRARAAASSLAAAVRREGNKLRDSAAQYLGGGSHRKGDNQQDDVERYFVKLKQ